MKVVKLIDTPSIGHTSRAVPRSQAEVFVGEGGESVEVVQRYPDGDCLYYDNGVLSVGRLEEVTEA